MSLKSIVLFAAVLGATSAQGHPKIYTYLDADGVRHYTDVPDNNRYRLLVLSPQDMTAKRGAIRSMLLAKAGQYDSIIEKAAISTSVEANLLRAVIVVESGFNSHAVSKRGAVGLMQLMPATATRFGVSNPYDPRQNVHAGARYFKFLWIDSGTTCASRSRHTMRARMRSIATAARFRRSRRPWPTCPRSQDLSHAADQQASRPDIDSDAPEVVFEGPRAACAEAALVLEAKTLPSISCRPVRAGRSYARRPQRPLPGTSSRVMRPSGGRRVPPHRHRAIPGSRLGQRGIRRRAAGHRLLHGYSGIR